MSAKPAVVTLDKKSIDAINKLATQIQKLQASIERHAKAARLDPSPVTIKSKPADATPSVEATLVGTNPAYAETLV